MNSRAFIATFGCCWLTVCSVTLAQELLVVPPPMEFETSTEHYAYLLEQADGGTQHTMETISAVVRPVGKPTATTNNDIFLAEYTDERIGSTVRGSVRSGVLSAAVRRGVQGAATPGRRDGPAVLRPPDPLRTAGLSPPPARTLCAGVSSTCRISPGNSTTSATRIGASTSVRNTSTFTLLTPGLGDTIGFWGR